MEDLNGVLTLVPMEEKGEEQTRGGCVQQPGDPAFGWIVYEKIYITEPKKPKDLNSEIKAKTKNHSKPSIKPSGVWVLIPTQAVVTRWMRVVCLLCKEEDACLLYTAPFRSPIFIFESKCVFIYVSIYHLLLMTWSYLQGRTWQLFSERHLRILGLSAWGRLSYNYSSCFYTLF